LRLLTAAVSLYPGPIEEVPDGYVAKGILSRLPAPGRRTKDCGSLQLISAGIMTAEQVLDFIVRSSSKAMKQLKTSVSRWAKHGLTSTRTKHATAETVPPSVRRRLTACFLVPTCDKTPGSSPFPRLEVTANGQ
jgi:hypothetical protein